MKLTEDQLHRYVDQRYIERGREYFEQGLVVFDKVTNSEVEAACSGSHVYKINLIISRGRLSGNCTCPAFENFGPCKHIAATALAIMASRKGQYTASGYATERVGEYRAVCERLLNLDKSELVNIVLQLAEEEDILWLLD